MDIFLEDSFTTDQKGDKPGHPFTHFWLSQFFKVVLLLFSSKKYTAIMINTVCFGFLVSSAKLKRKKNWFGTAIYTELAADGEIRKTAKSSSSSNPKWDEQLTV